MKYKYNKKAGALNEIAPQCFVEMSREDAGKYELADGANIRISSRRGTIDATVKVPILYGVDDILP